MTHYGLSNGVTRTSSTQTRHHEYRQLKDVALDSMRLAQYPL